MSMDPDRIGPAIFVIGRGGGGHKASGVAVRDCLQLRHGDASVEGRAFAAEIEFIEASGVVEKAIHGGDGNNGDDAYNWCLQNGWYTLAGLMGYFASFSAGVFSDTIVNGFADLFAEQQPSVVVSFVPFLNGAMRRGLAIACPSVKLVTVITDFASSSAHPWIDPMLGEDGEHRNHILVAGTSAIAAEAEQQGYKHIIRTHGMVVNPVFYAGHARSGTPAAPTILIFFGGHAPPRAQTIAENILERRIASGVVVICGGNASLEEALRARVEEFGGRLVVEGVLQASEVRDHMMAATCVVGKPGPGVATEASVCHTPLVLERTVGLSQEEIVQEWLEATGLGVVVDDLENLPADLLEQVEGCRQPLAAQENRAVFDVADALRALVPERPVRLAQEGLEGCREQVDGCREPLAAQESRAFPAVADDLRLERHAQTAQEGQGLAEQNMDEEG